MRIVTLWRSTCEVFAVHMYGVPQTALFSIPLQIAGL